MYLFEVKKQWNQNVPMTKYKIQIVEIAEAALVSSPKHFVNGWIIANWAIRTSLNLVVNYLSGLQFLELVGAISTNFGI